MSILLRNQIKSQIIKDLKEKMVFLGGPRQVGKTTIGQSLIKNYKDGHPAYLNWDDIEQRKKNSSQAMAIDPPENASESRNFCWVL